MRILRPVLLLILLGLLAGCATNPVTGESELTLVSESSELEIGNKQYAPTRQTQGGDYILEPDLTRYVQRVGNRLVAVSDRKLPYEFSIVNDSSPNAWALPGGKIAINRGLLLELQNEAELAAVLGHEIVHAAARHSAQGMERGMLLQGALIAAGMAAGNTDYQPLVVGAAALGANLVNQRYSREAELESDQYGMVYMQRAGYDPRAAIGLQETFVRLSEGGDQNWLSGLFASHPPSPARVEENRKTAARLGAEGGRLGVDEYRRMTAGLRRNKEAYAAFDEGRELLEKSPRKALKLADKAISIEPREAIFYSLKGDALVQQKKYKEAKTVYDQAVKRNAGFFRPLLKRGLVKAKLGDEKGAQRDLQRSLKLLPTADAHYALGRMALTEDDQSNALQHFKSAATSSSPVGKAAGREIAKLEVGRNPSRYLKAGLGRDRSGYLVVEVANQTRLGFRDLVVLVGRRDASGRIYRGQEFNLDGALGPGESTRFRTSITGVTSKQLKQYGARVQRARVVN